MGLKSKQISNDDVDSWNKTLLDISSTSTKNHQEQQQQPAEALDCPRCGSRNTKFCYYNNYNRSQPRHFCKACKRYWTNGGTLRNVPIGGAGRKNKRLKTLLNSAKTTTVPIPDRQDYCINLHLPPQEGLKAVSDNQNNISEFLFEALSVDSTSPQDGSQNLSFSGGLESFHLNGNPSPIPGIYDCSSQLESIASSSITENYSSIFCQQLQGQELINCWSLNDLDTLISADDLNYVPWDDAEEINK